MFERVRFTVAALVIAFTLTACGGGGGGSSLFGGTGSSGSSTPGGNTPASGSRTITMTLTIPSSSASTSSTGRSIVMSAVRKPATISSQTASISVTVNGGTPQVYNAATTCNLSANPITCTLNIGAPYGLDSFLILTYSGPNATGTILNAAAVTIYVTASGPNSATAVAGTVITVNDSADGSGQPTYSCASGSTTCTLREAVAEASTTAGVVTAIMFQGVTSITLTQANGAIQINGQTIEILGPGASAVNPTGIGAPSASGNLTISGGNATQLFYVSSGSLTVDGLTLSSGNSSDGEGGAIENYGAPLAIVNAIFSKNTAEYEGGAVYDCSSSCDQGTSMIVASTFTNNSAEYGGAYGDEEGAAFERSLFTNNTAYLLSDCGYGEGGAIYGDWNLSVDTSTFTGNVAGSTTVSMTYGEGGAISIEYNGASPTITNSTFGGSTASAGNFAGGPGPNDDGYGGAIYNDGDYPLTMSGNTFGYNLAEGGYDAWGGAIYDYEGITSTSDTFTNNIANGKAGTQEYGGYVGGGAVASYWVTSWTSDTFTGNQALGGIATVGAYEAEAYGGAIDASYGNDQPATPSFTASQTTFSNNTASAASDCYGGAVYAYSDDATPAITLSNVQFTGNSCTATDNQDYAYAFGGGLVIDYTEISLSGVTFTGNTVTATSTATNCEGPCYGYAVGGGFEYLDGYYSDPPGPPYQGRNPAAAARFATLAAAAQTRLAKIPTHIQDLRTRHASPKSKRAVRAVIHDRAAVTVRTPQQSGPANGIASSTFTGNSANGGSAYSVALGGGADLSGQPTVTGTTFSGNKAYYPGTATGYAGGGGLSTCEWSEGSELTVTASITGNTATNGGGGIDNYYCQTTVLNSTIASNRATNMQYPADGGGGINNDDGFVLLQQSTVNANTAAASSTVTSAGGGGVMTDYDAETVVLNSTLFANGSAIDGGGAENYYYSYLIFVNATVYQNTALGKGGSVDNEYYGCTDCDEVYIVNSIFAGGSAPAGTEIANLDTFYSYGGNLIQGAVSGNAIPAASEGTIADLLGVSPALSSAGLANNGGPTQTIADTSSSPGKGHIPFSGGYCGDQGPNVDQRNYTRGAGGVCDIGAYEFSGVPSSQPAASTVRMPSFVKARQTPH